MHVYKIIKWENIGNKIGNRKYLLKIVIFLSIFFNIYFTREKILGYMWGICAGFELRKKSRFARNIRAKSGKQLLTCKILGGFYE